MSRRFDSYTMVFVGKNPLADLIPLPYAGDVIESYRILVPTHSAKDDPWASTK
jgi:hypothetical protein